MTETNHTWLAACSAFVRAYTTISRIEGSIGTDGVGPVGLTLFEYTR